MKKIFALSCAAALVFLASCSSQSPDASSPAPESTQPLVEESQSPDLERMVGIPGSYIKDIQIGVSRMGMEDDSAEGAPDGAPYRWTASKMWNFPDTNIQIDYSIIGDDDSQLISGSFGATWDGLTDQVIFQAAAVTYLGFIATVPYDTNDVEVAKQWVSDNIPSVASGEPISTTIGDAVFTLSGTLAASGDPSSFLLQIAVAE